MRRISGRTDRAWRIAWTATTLLAVETAVCGLAAAPVVAIWAGIILPLSSDPGWRAPAIAFALGPSYIVFALALSLTSAAAARLTGWQTPDRAELRIQDLEWPLLNWVRYMAIIHVERLLAGTLLRSTPVWTACLRLHGARIGRRVYINSLAVSDYNLLEFGDDVVIGADAHISGHTVEHGVVKTGRAKLGDRVTIGIGTVIDIDVEIAEGSQIGALSFVPKHTKLPSGVFGGVPAHRIAS
jgi:acetyltransferase-like isoleucine patch superfamily enzyme